MQIIEMQRMRSIAGGDGIIYLSPEEAFMAALEGVRTQRMNAPASHPALVGLEIELAYIDCGCGAHETAQVEQLPKR